MMSTLFLSALLALTPPVSPILGATDSLFIPPPPMEWAPLGDERRLSHTISGDQDGPIFVRDRSGNCIVVYRTPRVIREDGGESRTVRVLVARILDARGYAQSGELELLRFDAPPFLRRYGVFALEDGFLLWSQRWERGDSTDYTLEVVPIHAEGPRFTTVPPMARTIKANVPLISYWTDVAVSPDGTLLLTWAEGISSGDCRVVAQRVDAQGSPVGSELELSGTPSDPVIACRDLRALEITIGNDGAFRVHWAERIDEETEAHRFYTRTVEPVTGALGDRISHPTPSHRIIFPIRFASLPDGSFVALWQDRPKNDFWGGRLWARRFGLDGTARELVDLGPRETWIGSVSAAPGGQILVSETLLDSTIRLRSLDAAGRLAGPPLDLASTPESAVAAAADPRGGWQISYSQHCEVYLRRLTAAGVWADEPTKLSAASAADTCRYPAALEMAGPDLLLATWVSGGLRGAFIPEPPPPVPTQDGDGAAVYARLLQFAAVDEVRTDLLLQERFEVTASWRDPRTGAAGMATAHRWSPQAGLFSILERDSVEVTVKLLDARLLNGQYWLFAAATTDLEITLTMRDRASDLERSWELSGHRPTVVDLSATRGMPLSAPTVAVGPVADRSDRRARAVRAQRAAGEHRVQVSGRFELSLTWTSAAGASPVRPAAGLPYGRTAAIFWRDDPTTPEVTVKVLDGRDSNGAFHVSVGSVTDRPYELFIRDLATGLTTSFSNLEGQVGSFVDVSTLRSD